MSNITKNLWIRKDGKVIFQRSGQRDKRTVVLETINDAISQNGHILDNLFVELVDCYGQSFIKPGEISTMRDILETVQKNTKMAASGLKEQTFDMSGFLDDLDGARNRHKKEIAKLIKDKSLGSQEMTQIAVHTVRRIGELQSIIKGTLYQLNELMKIKRDADKKINYAYNQLVSAEFRITRASITPEKDGREKILKEAVRDISGKGANKVLFTLKAVTPVNPYKERIQSKEIKDLKKLNQLLSDWKRNEADFGDFIKITSKARSKLKRLILEQSNFKMIDEYLERSDLVD